MSAAPWISFSTQNCDRDEATHRAVNECLVLTRIIVRQRHNNVGVVVCLLEVFKVLVAAFGPVRCQIFVICSLLNQMAL
jgi:hypothetical protein